MVAVKVGEQYGIQLRGTDSRGGQAHEHAPAGIHEVLLRSSGDKRGRTRSLRVGYGTTGS